MSSKIPDFEPFAAKRAFSSSYKAIRLLEKMIPIELLIGLLWSIKIPSDCQKYWLWALLVKRAFLFFHIGTSGSTWLLSRIIIGPPKLLSLLKTWFEVQECTRMYCNKVKTIQRNQNPRSKTKLQPFFQTTTKKSWMQVL